MTGPVINIDDAVSETTSRGKLYAETFAALSAQIGAKKLGYNVTTLPPGKRSCPYHSHHVNEEMFFILAGAGVYRFGGKVFPVKAGDICAAPPGGPETAHHIVNTGGEPMRYLSVSTMEEPDICEYPDSGKFQVMSGSPPGGDRTKRLLTHIGRNDASLDYWDGEKID